jgi:hypothetical protein
LGSGDNRIAGNAATAGHTDDKALNPNADLDVFVFTVPVTGDVTFRLIWETTDDLDMIVYGGVTEPSVLNFESGEILSSDAATTAQPEEVTLRLSSAEQYWVLVANWEGDPDIDYVLEIDAP